MFLIRTLLSQGTILCIVLLLVTLDVGFSTAKATTKPGKLLLVLAGCLILFGGMELLSRGSATRLVRSRRSCSWGGWGCWGAWARWPRFFPAP